MWEAVRWSTISSEIVFVHLNSIEFIKICGENYTENAGLVELSRSEIVLMSFSPECVCQSLSFRLLRLDYEP